MAERLVARAYLRTGDPGTAALIYARYGDVHSLMECGLKGEEDVWRMVYENCPNSPFFLHELQFLLTHIDNEYIIQQSKWWNEDAVSSNEGKRVQLLIALADRALSDGKVKDVAVWYYAKAALQHSIGWKSQALRTLKEDQKACPEGSFLASSMRVLRILIEAETVKYDAAYEARLCEDIKWLCKSGRANTTKQVKERFRKHRASSMYDEMIVRFTNQYYWGDVLNRILVGALAPRLKEEGRTTEAFLYANLGVFWVMKDVYGKTESPNAPDAGMYSVTNLSNDLTRMADSCQVEDLVKVWKRIAKPQCGIDSLVVRYGKTDKSYWHDQIGIRYLAEHNYPESVKWLKGVSRSYQRNMSTWPYCDRNPFCFKFYWSTKHRTRYRKSQYDYKLNYEREMAALEQTMKTGKDANVRGVAMIRYGVGFRNQDDWC